jgi:hypothetical protein
MKIQSNPIANEIMRKYKVHKKGFDESDKDYIWSLMTAIKLGTDEQWDNLSVQAQQHVIFVNDEYTRTGNTPGFPETPYLVMPDDPEVVVKNQDLMPFWNYKKNAADKEISRCIRRIALTRPYFTAKEIRDYIFKEYGIKVAYSTVNLGLSHTRAIVRMLWANNLLNENDLVKIIIPRGKPDPINDKPKPMLRPELEP